MKGVRREQEVLPQAGAGSAGLGGIEASEQCGLAEDRRVVEGPQRGCAFLRAYAFLTRRAVVAPRALSEQELLGANDDAGKELAVLVAEERLVPRACRLDKVAGA